MGQFSLVQSVQALAQKQKKQRVLQGESHGSKDQSFALTYLWKRPPLSLPLYYKESPEA